MKVRYAPDNVKCMLSNEEIMENLSKHIDRLQREKLELLRDWSDSQNVFVKSVRKLEIKVAERDLRIKELIGILEENGIVY